MMLCHDWSRGGVGLGKTYVLGVVGTGKVIGKLPDGHGQVHFGIFHRNKGIRPEFVIVTEDMGQGCVGTKEFLQDAADLAVDCSAEASIAVQRRLEERLGVKAERIEDSTAGEHLEVEDAVADTHANALVPVPRAEHSVREVLQGEVRLTIACEPAHVGSLV